jgi:hypothetical protein
VEKKGIIHSHRDLNSVSSSTDKTNLLVPSRLRSPAPRVCTRTAASSASLILKPAGRNSLELISIDTGGRDVWKDRDRAELYCLLDVALLIGYCLCSELRFRNTLHVQVDETARSTRDHLYFTRCHHTGTICLTSRQSDTCFALIFLSVCLFPTV